MLKEHNKLKNRYVHIRWETTKQDIGSTKQDIRAKKQDIQEKEKHIEVPDVASKKNKVAYSSFI